MPSKNTLGAKKERPCQYTHKHSRLMEASRKAEEEALSGNLKFTDVL